MPRPWWKSRRLLQNPCQSSSTKTPSYFHLPPPPDINSNIFTWPFNSSSPKMTISTLDLPQPSYSSFRSTTSAPPLIPCNPPKVFHLGNQTITKSPFRLERLPRMLLHLRHNILTIYRLLFTTIVLLNLIPLFLLLSPSHHNQIGNNRIDPTHLATAASTNFLIAIIIRQDITINAIFRTAWLIPWSLPLRIRIWAARCYCYGGVHSGCAVVGSVWWVWFSVALTMRFLSEASGEVSRGDPLVVIKGLVLSTTFAILGLLGVIMLFALPVVRDHRHNAFELTHRFMGWLALLLFWIEIMLLSVHDSKSSLPSSSHSDNGSSPSPQDSFAHILLHTPTFWSLAIMTAMLVYPWIHLRKWVFTAEVLSEHAVRLWFEEPVHKFSCLAIAERPLGEWHPFATFPSPSLPSPSSSSSHDSKMTNTEGLRVIKDEKEHSKPQKGPNSLIISAAGDWTRSIITKSLAFQTHQTQTLSFYTKGHPHSGLLSLTLLFPRVILVTTGSGIGPALSSLIHCPLTQKIRLIWSTRAPIDTYGEDIYTQVMKAEPGAVIIDTDAVGRPDLVEVAWRLYKDIGDGEGAEVVFILSNKRVTKRVRVGLEGRGVPCFGPVWDS